MSFAVIDVVFGLIVVTTFLTGLRKGFIENIINKLAWVFALIGACMLYSQVAVSLQSTISSELLAKLLAFVLVFSVIFIVCMLFKMIFTKLFRGNVMRSLDTALGGLFGAVEGIAISFLVIYLLELQNFVNVEPVLSGSFFRSLMSSVASQI